MTYGFRFKGSHGFTQIDQQYSNMVLLRKGTITSMQLDRTYNYPAAGGGNTIYNTYFLDIKTDLPLDGYYCIAVKSDVPTLVHYRIPLDSNNNQVGWRLLSRGNGNVNITYYIFGYPKYAPTPAGKWGVQLLDPATNTVRYDSRMNYLKILDTVTPILARGGGWLSPSAYTDYAIMPSSPVLQWTRFPGSGFMGQGQVIVYGSGFITTPNSNAVSSEVGVASAPSSANTPGNRPEDSNYPEKGSFYVIDVSGL